MVTVRPNQDTRFPSSPTAERNHSSKERKTKNHHGQSKRARRVDSFHAMVLDQVDEGTVETESPTVHSTSTSENSSKASNTSEPALLDFIGATCFASAWFTSCFPCAVVDINDKDCDVVDRLSRASAMNVMYSTPYEWEKPSEIQVPSSSADDLKEKQYLSHRTNENAQSTIRTQVIDHHELMKLRKASSHVSGGEDDSDATDSVGTISLNEEPLETPKLNYSPFDDDLVYDDAKASPLAEGSDQNSSQRRKRFNFSRPKGMRFGKRKQ